MEASVIVTYRCNARCHMCNIWEHPTSPANEISPQVLEKLPQLAFCNITGGEPFAREDIEDVVAVIGKKARRTVISTNGYFTEKILSMAEKNPGIGIRISLEGLPSVNDGLRGLKGGFDRGLRTLLELHRMGMKDIGFGVTISDRNARDTMELYQLAKAMKVEFSAAAVHNSDFFHKYDNEIKKQDDVLGSLRALMEDLISTYKVKNWFRAYFIHGLMGYVKGQPRLLPCEAGAENFFVDPFGEVLPCNGLENTASSWSMGNLNEKDFTEIWNGETAGALREKARRCTKNCWMMCTVAPAMKKHITVPLAWVAANKAKRMLGMRLGT